MRDTYFPTYDYVTDERGLVDNAVVAEVIEEAESFLVVKPESIREKLERWAAIVAVSMGEWPVH